MRQSRRLGRLDRTSVATPIVDILLKHREWRNVPKADILVRVLSRRFDESCNPETHVGTPKSWLTKIADSRTKSARQIAPSSATGHTEMTIDPRWSKAEPSEGAPS
jgi:hypothetical protein